MIPHDVGFIRSTQAAIGKGTCVAAKIAGIILVNNDQKDGVQMFEFGRKTYRKIIQNQAWAIGYNVRAMLIYSVCIILNFLCLVLQWFPC